MDDRIMKKNGNISLQGHIMVPQDRLEAVRSALPLHISLSRKELGCLSFNVTESSIETGRFNVNERFSDQDSFDAHQKRGATSAWAEITAGIPRHYTVTKD